MRRRRDVEQIFRREMLKRRTQYVAHSLAQVQTLRSVLQQLEGPRVPAEALEQLITITHRLHGSGQIYGLPDLTRLAGRLENQLRVVEENRGRLSGRQRRSILSQIRKLAAVLKPERETTTPSSDPSG